ncbi:MAG: Ig-like domain-containing protein, partial [Myxococcales bacterium]|nr:Ig-like domain-containing protein [Myxococcales bacterium]
TSATETDATTDETTDATTDEPTTEAATPPEVVMVVPDDGALGVDPKPQLAVTFSEVMNLNSITANTVDDVCQGSVQLSADGFATCVQIAAKPDTDDSLTFTLTPAGFLESATDYQLRVTTFAEDLEGEALVADYESAGFTIRYFHTITIDGLDDFTGDELFATTTPMFTGRVAWDTAFLYLGFQGPDFADGAPDAGSKFLVVYLGGPMGTASGVTYNTQQPTLPFSARWHLRYKLDDSFTSVLTWSGNAWVETGWSLVGATDHADDFVELRLPLAMLGDPDAIDLHASVLNEKGFAEATFAGVPDSSFVDGYDPDYGAHFTFELKGSTLPADTLP